LHIGGDVSGQTIVVTGPTSGIGEQTASTLARRGATVILACRNLEKGEAVKRRLLQEAEAQGRSAPKLEVHELDVASLASVRSFAERWSRSGRGIHALINNAGIFSIGARREVSKDGFEAHLGTNYLGAFLLVLLLLPTLQKTGTAESPARVVLVSSVVHHCCGRMLRQDMNFEQSYFSLRAYGHSKLAQVLFAAEMRRRMPQDGSVAIFACHPGECNTDIVRTLPGPLRSLYHLIIPPFLITPKRGGLSSLFCATSNPRDTTMQYQDPDSCYVGCGCSVEKPSVTALDPEEAAWLWEWSCRSVKLPESAALQRQ